MAVAQVPIRPNQIRKRRLLRSRSSRWLAGVFGGLGEYLGVGPGWLRLAFIFFGLASGVGLAAYVLAWIVVPSERAEGTQYEDGDELKGLLIGVVASAAALIALLLIESSSWVTAAVVAAPVTVGLGAVFLRRGPGTEKGILLAAGLLFTLALGIVNYQPGMGDRVLRPSDPNQLYGGSGYSNVFGDLTVDLSAMSTTSGYGTVRANTVFGDLTVILPPNADLEFDGTIAFGDVDALGSKMRSAVLGSPSFAEERESPLRITLEVFSAFGTVRVVR
jgi:phage shock protein PspC (stress-responsive transcriptional regulator)